MTRPSKPQQRATLPLVRCAIYTRKSTEEGLEQEFNSLDAQRESGEAFVASQQHEGWRCLPDRYDDGGFSGGNTDRPALRRLMADVQAGKVDMIVVYKVDRLSRSLLDFAKLMETFDKHRVGFVSVTQQFNTATSMGRLVLNVLLSFAQFEGEIISERTRDKVAATRRKGKYSGGAPILGYDLDRERSRLVVNEDEAVKVKAIFALYLEHEALLPVVQELQRREWRNKRWVTKANDERGGEEFTKTSLHRLLTNVTYAGKVSHKGQVHQGEHPPIIDEQTWQKAQALLMRNSRSGGAEVRNQFGALLKGLLRCAACGCSMTPAHTSRGSKRYRYYTCTKAQKMGHGSCPSKSVPAGPLEEHVVEQIRAIGRDPELVAQTIAQGRQQDQQQLAELEAERRTLDRDLTRWDNELRAQTARLAHSDDVGEAVSRLGELQNRIDMGKRRLLKVKEQMQTVRQGMLHEEDARLALSQFDPVWEAMPPHEQSRLLGLLVERIDYDGGKGTLEITFHPTGIKTLADELASHDEEDVA